MNTIAAGINIALQLNASRAFQKLADMEKARYAEVEAIFGSARRAITADELAEIEDVFGSGLAL